MPTNPTPPKRGITIHSTDTIISWDDDEPADTLDVVALDITDPHEETE